jgi:hypothetical protein
LCVGISLAGACGGGELPSGTFDGNTHAIEGGTNDTGDRAVVAVLVSNAQGTRLCGGTLVAPDRVLTVAHCLVGATAAQVHFGTNATGDDGGFDVAAASASPDPDYDANSPDNGHDLGMLVLGRQVTEVAPQAANLYGDISVRRGLSARLVGFGVDDANGDGGGLKRQVTTVISAPDPFFPDGRYFITGSTTQGACPGDDGSPGLGAFPGPEMVVGVATNPNGAICGSAYYTRVDTHARFLMRIYSTLLGRTADRGGLVNHTDAMFLGSPALERARIFVDSTESHQKTVRDLYQLYLNRAPDPSGLSHFTPMREREISLGILGSTEYSNRFPSNGNFVDSLYMKMLGRAADAGGRAHWIAVLASGGSRVSVAASFYDSLEHHNKQVGDAFLRFLGHGEAPSVGQPLIDLLNGGTAIEGIWVLIIGSPDFYEAAVRLA